MKKLISLALVLIMVLSFAGCSKGEANGDDNQNSSAQSETQKIYADEARTILQTKGEAWTLANTYKKLTQDKKLNVAYIGGSVTRGTGSTLGNSWREITTKWLKSTYPNAAISETNAAIGGTGSLWGLMRLERDLLVHNPDLVFVEFAINDVYTGSQKIQAAANIDAIIRKINEHNPETDIIVVLVTDEANSQMDYPVKQGHREVAQYYGIPFIDVGNALVTEIGKTGNEWDNYFIDNVHPNDNGYKVYADEIEKNLKNLLNEGKSKTPKKHDITGMYAVTNPYKTLEMLDISKIGDEKWRYSAKNTMGYGTEEYISPKEGAKLNFEFEGSTLAAFCRIKKGCQLKITIDGTAINYVEQGTDDNFADTILLDNLTPGKHNVTIEYLGPGIFVVAALIVC